LRALYHYGFESRFPLQRFETISCGGWFEELDGWLRQKLRRILWKQWKRPYTRAKKLMRRGLTEATAWKSATNGRCPWWNAGAAHMHKAVPKSYFDKLQAGITHGPASPNSTHFMNRRVQNRTHGGVGGRRE